MTSHDTAPAAPGGPDASAATPAHGRRRATAAKPALRPYQLAIAAVIVVALVSLIPISISFQQGKDEAAVSEMPTAPSITGGEIAPVAPEATPAPAPEGGVVQPLDDEDGPILAERVGEPR